ncbi:MAG: hypothetical protein ACTSQS_15395 [Promethearchaeota archaeon]
MSNIKVHISLNRNIRITNIDLREMFKPSDEGALKEIKKLVKLGLLKVK